MVSVPLVVILKTVPQPLPLHSVVLAPPLPDVPYKFPSVAWTSPANGFEPSVQPLFEQKL